MGIIARFSPFRRVLLLGLFAAVLPGVALAQSATPTPAPTPTKTPGPIAYSPKQLSAKCSFLSDKLIEKGVAEQIKVSLAGRGIASPRVRVKLNKTAATEQTLDPTKLQFSASQVAGGAALEYGIVSNTELVGFECSSDRILDITVSAKVNGTKASSTSHVHLKVRGLLK